MSFKSWIVAFVVSMLVLLAISCRLGGAQVAEVRIFDSARPPCNQLPGSDRDPCERTLEAGSSTDSDSNTYYVETPPLPLDPEWLYRSEWSRQGVRTPQIVVRGIVAPGSARCSEVRAYHYGGSDHGSWGVDSERTLEVCHVDVNASEYLVGSGPSRFPLLIRWYRSVLRTGSDYGTTTYFEDRAAPFRASMEGSERIFELTGPYDFAWGDWTAVHTWDVQRKTDGTIVGVSGMWRRYSGHSDIEDWEYPLDELQRKLKAAHATVAAEHGGRISDEPDSPMLVTDASRENLLGQLRELGAYDAPGITPVPAPPAPIPPVEPGELAASPPNDAGGIPLSWTAPDSGIVSGYKVVRRVPKGEFVTVVADTGSTATTYTDTSAPMTAGVTYIYRVLALNEYGESLASNRATVELPGPDAPADFTATNYEGDVVLTWTQPGVIMPSCYRIYRRAQGEQSFEWVVNCWSADLRSWRDDDVESGTRYIYRIVPMIGSTESDATARASITVR